MRDERSAVPKREYGGAQKRQRHGGRARHKPDAGILVLYIAASGLLIVFNLFLVMKLLGDVGRLREQLNKISSSVARLQQDIDMSAAAGEGGSAAAAGSVSRLPGAAGGQMSSDGSHGAAGSQASYGGSHGAAGGQVLCEGSYGAEWGLDRVDRPMERSVEEAVYKLTELGKENGVIAQISKSSWKYPEEMLKALANNPELAGFVSGYEGVKARASGGFAREELALDFPLFLQWDPRWGYVGYGDGSCIGLAGCGPTCLSMALYYLTGDEEITPDAAAAYSMEKGYWVSGAGTAWGLLTDLPAKYGVRVSEPSRSEQAIYSALDQGKIVICSMGPGDFTAAGHFIVIYGYDRDGLMVNDPNCVARSMMRWSYADIASQIKHIWVLGGEPDTGGAYRYVEAG